MELKLSKQDQDFRDEVRSFVEKNLASETQRKMRTGKKLAKDDFVRWQKVLAKQGWVAPGWPKEWGGTDWTPIQKYLFDEELAIASTPPVIPFGVSMVAPVIMAFGNDEQKNHYLPRIYNSEDWWCQGYSEPGAGSDLASLMTKAVPDGDDYIVNGTKTWTTYAQYADMMFCLVRTDSSGKKQEGISFLLIDMTSPGITVQPIKTFDGGKEINEVFLEDVRVPKKNLVGEEGKGWTYAKFLLGHERTGIAQVGRSKRQIEKLKWVAANERVAGGTLADDPDFQAKVAAVEIDTIALEYTVLRVLSAVTAGEGPGPESSILKIKGTEIQQAITELFFEAVGYYANPYLPESFEAGWNEEPIGPDYAAAVAPTYFNWRKASIYGGTNEIQKNIIAKWVLGY